MRTPLRVLASRCCLPLDLPEPYPDLRDPSHGPVGGTVAAFGRHPCDVLSRVLDVAGFAMDAVGCVDHKARFLPTASDYLEHSCRAVPLRRLRVDGQILPDR